MVNIGKWIRSILLPEVEELKGGVKSVNTKLDSLEKVVNIKFDAQEKIINTRLDQLEGKIDVFLEKLDTAKKYAVLEERVSKLEAKN